MSGYRRGALRDGVALALVLSTATLHATCCASGWRCIAHIARVSSAEINTGTHFCCTICIMCSMGLLSSASHAGRPNLSSARSLSLSFDMIYTYAAVIAKLSDAVSTHAYDYL